MDQPPRQRRDGRAGFTLVEVMVVVAILGMMFQLVVPNLQRDIPETNLRSTANRLTSILTYLRDEARLQGGEYGLELDPKNRRFRIVLPPEQRKVELGEEAPKAFPLTWMFFDEGVALEAVHIGDKEPRKDEQTRIVFDSRGATAPKVLWLATKTEPPVQMSILVPALAGRIESRKGQVQFPTATDLDF
ncbi:MAG: prepilin-type N-terminal cleavage/methylation domain-containing protein [Planctomycetota bacterium]